MNTRTIIQNIHAPVYGHVAAGDIHASSSHQEPESLWDWPLSQLRETLAARRAEYRAAWWRSWLNWQTGAMALMLICGAFLALYLLTHLGVPSGQRTTIGGFPLSTIAVGLFAVLMMFAAWSLERIRRVERSVMLHVASEIDQLELVLRRRTGR